ncbi:MAG TPA: hypothetical protein VMX96_03935 [Dehalococcoidia bacterium]|nr:hypothetical protein [Dehalococcoidia bacterium]
MGFLDAYDNRKRTLGIRDKQILYRNANGICDNPKCGRKIDFDEMEVGHKTAFSKGGNITLKTAKCLCHRCNKLQGTDSWDTFLKKQRVIVTNPKAEMKASLAKLKLGELKQLAKKHDVSVKGKIVEYWFHDEHKAPTKAEYINKLSIIVTEKEIKTLLKDKRET